MLHPYESDSKILHRTPSESHDEWISRITAHPLEEYERETAELLSDTQVKEMVDEVQNIFSQETNEKKDELGTDSETAKINDQERRSIKLTKILPILAQLWWLNSERLDITTELLANGSRENENRSRIAASSDYFLAITKQLKFPSMLPYALPVLYNICVDYVPNQELASKSFLTRELGILIKSPTFDKSLPTFEYVCRIMTLLMSQPSEVNFAPDYTVSILFRTLADNKSPVDIDNFITLTKIAICYLQHEKFQKAFICADGSLDDIITVLVDSYTRYDIQPDTAENDDFKALTNLRTSLNQALSDISALPEFTQACPISSHFSKTLQQWLVAPCPKLQLQLCSCFMLGNLARCDETCIEFVQTLQLHKPLITIASKETSSQILHATLCFLKNLAIPLKNKNSIGEERFFHMLCRILTLDNIPQVQFSAASLARQLTIGTYENVYRLLHEKSTGSTATTFSLLCNLFITANDEPIKMEIARLTTSICRVLHSHTGASQNLIESTRAQFFQMYSDTSSHLKYVVSQSKWSVVRSEGWFVLALISRFAEGAKFVNQILQDPEFSELLTQLLVGDIIVSTSSNSTASLSTLLSEESAVSDTLDVRPEPVKPHFKADEMARIDKENALVLVSEILKNVSKDIPVPQCMKLKELLNCGGKYLMDKSKKTKSYNIL